MATAIPRRRTATDSSNSAGLVFMMDRLLFNAQGIDDAGDPLTVLIDEFFVVIAAQENGRPAEFVKGGLPRRRVRRCLDEFHQRIALGRGNAGSAEDAAPVRQLHVNRLFFERANAFDARWRRYGQRAHATTLNLLGELADTR